jgi:RNA polymerase sigma-70 factor, ECF subfamily
MNPEADARVTRTGDPKVAPEERGMYAKEAVLGGETARTSVVPRSAGGRAIDAEFVTALEAELAMAYRLAGYLMGDSAEAADAVQEASVRAWRAWPKLREREKFHSWFSQILVNVCRTHLGRRSRRRTEDVENVDVEAADPFRASLARDAVGRALPALSNELRIVVVLRYWGDMSLNEIAERLNIPLGTVKSRLHAALQTLRRRLEPAEGGSL